MSQTRKAIKRYLNEYRRLTEKIRQLDEDLEAIESEIGAKSLGDGAGVQFFDLTDPTAKLAVRLADIRLHKETVRSIAWSRREEIVRVIDNVQDTLQSRLLYDRYILLLTWEQVADDIHVNEVYARGRLHAAALVSAEEVYKERVNND